MTFLVLEMLDESTIVQLGTVSDEACAMRTVKFVYVRVLDLLAGPTKVIHCRCYFRTTCFDVILAYTPTCLHVVKVCFIR